MLVRMVSTFAPSSFSIARRISTLLASRATWKTIVRPSSRWIDVFSVMSGRRMMSVSFITDPRNARMRECMNARCASVHSRICASRDLREGLLQLLERGPRGDHAAGVDDVARGQARAHHGVHARDV